MEQGNKTSWYQKARLKDQAHLHKNTLQHQFKYDVFFEMMVIRCESAFDMLSIVINRVPQAGGGGGARVGVGMLRGDGACLKMKFKF